MFSISNRPSHHPGESAGGSGATLIPSVYWPYIMTQYRRAIAAFADGNALIDWPRPSKAQGRALISAVPRIRLGLRVIIVIFQYVIWGAAGRTGRFASRSGAQKFCPWRSVKCLKAPGRTADRRSLRAEYRHMPTAVIAAYTRSSLASIAGALTLKAWT